MGKCWSDAITVAEKATSELKKVLLDSEIISFDKELPLFLRSYTAGSVFTRTAWLGVDGFQKEKKHHEANELLTLLLSQQTYLPHYRGKWFERLIVNAKHLKMSTDKVQDIIRSALTDQFVHHAHKFSFSARLLKLKNDEEKAAKLKEKKHKNRRKKAKLDDETEGEDENVIADHSAFKESNADDKLLVFLRCKVPEKYIEGEKMFL